MTTEKKYGSWSSPISANNAQSNSIEYQYLCQDQSNHSTNLVVYWIEMRTQDNGRNVIVSRDINSSYNVIWTPESFSAQTRVHEYGGADCFVHSNIVYFSNGSDQHLYKQIDPQSEPIKLTKQNRCRYANGFYSDSLATILIVREDHRDEKNVSNTIVTIRDGVEAILVEGADFYSSPRVSNDGVNLCWIDWMHPNMPWDNTRLCVANIDPLSLTLIAGSIQTVMTGSLSNPISCTLPMWTVFDNLCYISDESGYWNLWIGKSLTNKTNLTPVDEDIGDPMWLFDYRKYNYLGSRNEFVVARKGGRLEFLKPDDSKHRMVDFAEHLTYICHCQLMGDGSVVALAYSSTTRKTIYRLWEDGRWEVLGQSRIVEDSDPRYFSVPRHLKYPVLNSFSYGYFYGPCNPNYRAPVGTLPPLLVQVHGGPTAAVFTDLDYGIQYWTSRGYAVFDVDYRGSTGYGKQYRHSLKRNWGVFDLEDCCEGVKYLVDIGLVDEDKVVIRGGSAGGYTTLCCLTFSSVFKAGSSSYGIGDLRRLVENTHKFESHYLELMIGDLATQGHLYYERSPIHFPGNINSSVIFFQGDEDPIVPMEQSEQMFDIVRRKGVPCSLVIYKGEQHGFRKIENIVHNIESEYYFFGRMLGLETPDISHAPIVIENYPG